jgi:hypothetical protein
MDHLESRLQAAIARNEECDREIEALKRDLASEKAQKELLAAIITKRMSRSEISDAVCELTQLAKDTLKKKYSVKPHSTT